MVVFLSEKDVQAALTMPRTIDLLEKAFSEHARAESVVLPRISQMLPGNAGMFRILAAMLPSQEVFGLKTLTGFPGRRLQDEIYFAILLFGMESGALRAVVSANYLTGLRTGAASGVAARYLARQDSHTLGIVGAGVQAWFQVEALSAVRDLHNVKIFSRNRPKAEAFASRLRDELSLEAIVSTDAEEVVRGSDLVVAATTASEAVIDGRWLEAGTHVSGIGANTRTKRELNGRCFARARVVADSREQALEESGDLRSAVEEGMVTKDVVYAELGELTAGLKQGRKSSEEITIFKSVGLAIQDITIAAEVLSIARHRGLGIALDPGVLSQSFVGIP